MKRNMLFGAGAAALACLLGGCRLAVPQGAAGQDTLIGGYATWESIPYFSEHFLSGDRSPARLYADWSSADRPEGAQWRNIFPNVTGYALCQNTAEEDGDTVYLGRVTERPTRISAALPTTAHSTAVKPPRA